jgi:hypothetical protein
MRDLGHMSSIPRSGMPLALQLPCQDPQFLMHLVHTCRMSQLIDLHALLTCGPSGPILLNIPILIGNGLLLPLVRTSSSAVIASSSSLPDPDPSESGTCEGREEVGGGVMRSMGNGAPARLGGGGGGGGDDAGGEMSARGNGAGFAFGFALDAAGLCLGGDSRNVDVPDLISRCPSTTLQIPDTPTTPFFSNPRPSGNFFAYAGWGFGRVLVLVFGGLGDATPRAD